MSDEENTPGEMNSLKGSFLIAMPSMLDPRFERSVVFICSHSEQGAMGFVLNKPALEPQFAEILDEIGLEEEATRVRYAESPTQVYSGGPVEPGRGFVLHSLEYGIATSSRIEDLAGITATIEILRAMARGHGPESAIMLLGYAGWGSGQLEEEISNNGWLTAPATREMIFDTPREDLYTAALAAIGVSVELLSGDAGHA